MDRPPAVPGTEGALRPERRFGPWRALLLLALTGAGVALLVLPALHAAVPVPLQRLAGATQCVYALFVVLAWFPMPWLSRRIADTFEDVIDEGQGGWYVVLAIAHFTLAEVTDAVARWAEFGSVADAVRQQIVEQLIGFSADTFMNALMASLWPIDLLRVYGPGPTLAIGIVAWALWRGGRRAFGEPDLAPLVRANG
jgi:hypothetical protein